MSDITPATIAHRRAILTTLKVAPATTRMLATVCGRSGHTTHGILSRMKAEGLIERVGRSGQAVIWAAVR